MVSSFLAAICGIALNTQVRMCSVTSQELLRPYIPQIEQGIRERVEHLGDNYLANGIAVGYNLGYRQQIDYGRRIEYIEANGHVTLSPRYVGLQLRWEH